ncbi:MAG: RNA polymerase sigma factor [Chloroflexota bacterium]
MNPFNQSKTVLLEAAFDRYYPAIFRFFRYRGADAETANDLAASVFERALTRIDQYDPHKAQIQTWLFAIARNLSINHWKLEKEALSFEDDDVSDTEGRPLEESLIRSLDKEQVLHTLQLLDHRSREVLALKFSGELSNREIAELTNLSDSNVGVILYRSLLKLRTLLTSSQVEAHHDR